MIVMEVIKYVPDFDDNSSITIVLRCSSYNARRYTRLTKIGSSISFYHSNFRNLGVQTQKHMTTLQ